MNKLRTMFSLVLVGIASALIVGSTFAAEKPAAVFEGKETLLSAVAVPPVADAVVITDMDVLGPR